MRGFHDAIFMEDLNSHAHARLAAGAGSVLPDHWEPHSKSPEGYASALFRVTREGVVEKVEDVVGDPGGTDWITASQELRRAVFVTESPSQSVIVVDFAKASVVKRCEKPKQKMALIEQWLWSPQDRGRVYVGSSLP